MAAILQQAEKERLLDVQMALITGEWEFEAVKDAFGLTQVGHYPMYPYKRIDHWRTLTGQEILPTGQEIVMTGISNHEDFDCDTFLQVWIFFGSHHCWLCSSNVTMHHN